MFKYLENILKLMKRGIILLFLIVFISGCYDSAENIPEEENVIDEENITNEIIEETPVDEKETSDCPAYDGDKEGCMLHEGCKWVYGENICNPLNDGGEEELNEELEAVIVPANPSNEICKKVPLLSYMSSSDRYYCMAVVNDNAKFCDGTDGENEKNICLAVVNEDSSYCKNIPDTGAKHVCYYQLAVISENIDFCDEIDYLNDNERVQCYFNFVSNMYWWDRSGEIKAEYCNKFPTNDPDKNTCLAFKGRDVSICGNNVNCLTFFKQDMSFCDGKDGILESCIRDRAMTEKDLSICETLSGEKRDDCIGDFCTHIQLDTSICDKINDVMEKQSRYVEVAINLDN